MLVTRKNIRFAFNDLATYIYDIWPNNVVLGFCVLVFQYWIEKTGQGYSEKVG